MTDSEHDGFLHRWSRRKTQARAGLPAADEAPADPAQGGEHASDGTGAASQGTLPAVRQAAPETPPLTLDDVRALTADSDFSPFVAARVAPQVKNAALKKLFSDPHYNVMDGLDVYIDDYSRMEPLPAPLLRRLASARALDMFEPDADTGAEVPQATQGLPPPADPQGTPAESRRPIHSPLLRPRVRAMISRFRSG
ncbi:DUF3306 domain-containing protein, partial [Bordetella petrii]|uniref:DUF3306 domain-containing protein n=1 Tax=Bordetella petrii TaxID=94624 RepID=UPI001E3BA0E1